MYLRPTATHAGSSSSRPGFGSWHTSEIRIRAPEISVESPAPFSKFAAFRDSVDSSVSSIASSPLPPKRGSPPKRHPFAAAQYSQPTPPTYPSQKPLPYQGAPVMADDYRHSYVATWNIAPAPAAPPPVPQKPVFRVQEQVLPEIFRRKEGVPPLVVEPAARLFHPPPLHQHNPLPSLPVPPSPNEFSSEDSHVEQVTFVTGHRRETMSVSSARAFTPVAPPPMPVRPRETVPSQPESPLPLPPSRMMTFNNGSLPSLVSPSPMSASSTSSPKVFTPDPETLSNRIPSKASKLLGLVPNEPERDELTAPKPTFAFGFGMSVIGGGGTGVGVHYHGHSSEGGSVSSTGSFAGLSRARPDEAAAYEAKRRPSYPPPPAPTRPLPHPVQVGRVSIERGGGVIPSKAKAVLGIRTESERLIRLPPARPPRSSALLSYLQDSDEDETPSSGSTASIGSENPFRKSFALAPLVVDAPKVDLVIPPSPAPFASLFSTFDFAAYPTAHLPTQESLRAARPGIPSGYQHPAYRESSLLPDEPYPTGQAPTKKGKNVKGLVLASIGSVSGPRKETLADARRRLRKKRSQLPAKSSDGTSSDPTDDHGNQTEVGEVTLRPAGAPPVALGRMDVATPTAHMLVRGRTKAQDSTAYLASIPSMILPHHHSLHLAQNPSLQPVASSPYTSYPLARSDSQRDYPTSPSNSSSADHHYQVQHELIPRTPDLPCRTLLGAGLRTWTEESERSRTNGGGLTSSSEEGHASEASRGTFGARHRRRG